MDPVYIVLIEEMKAKYPPVEDSIALGEWICKHGTMFPDWYTKEVVCGLEH